MCMCYSSGLALQKYKKEKKISKETDVVADSGRTPMTKKKNKQLLCVTELLFLTDIKKTTWR